MHAGATLRSHVHLVVYKGPDAGYRWGAPLAVSCEADGEEEEKEARERMCGHGGVPVSLGSENEIDECFHANPMDIQFRTNQTDGWFDSAHSTISPHKKGETQRRGSDT